MPHNSVKKKNDVLNNIAIEISKLNFREMYALCNSLKIIVDNYVRSDKR